MYIILAFPPSDVHVVVRHRKRLIHLLTVGLVSFVQPPPVLLADVEFDKRQHT